VSKSKRLTLEELQMTPEYQRLTRKQQLFVATYVAGGLLDGQYDAVEATRTAYKCKTVENARVMSYSLLQNIHIVEVLNRHFNVEPIEEFLRTLDRAIQNKKLTQAQISALYLKARILGFDSKLPGKKSLTGVIADVVEGSKKKKKDQEPAGVKESNQSSLASRKF